MEDLITRTVVQTCALSSDCSTVMRGLWQWGFWAGFVVGAVGGLIALILKRSEAM